MKKIILSMYICVAMALSGCAVGEASDNYEAGSTSENTQNVEVSTDSQEAETIVKEDVKEADSTLLEDIPNAELDAEGQPEYNAQELQNAGAWENIHRSFYYVADTEMVVEVWLTWNSCEAKICDYTANNPEDIKEVNIPWESYVVGDVSFFENEAGEKLLVVDRITGAHEVCFPLVYCMVDGEWVETFAEKAQEYTYELTLGDDLQGKVTFAETEIPFDASAWVQVYQDYGYYADGKKTDRAIELEKEISQRSFLPVESVTVENNELVLSTSVDNYAAWDDLVQMTARFAYVDGEWVITKVTGTELEYPY